MTFELVRYGWPNTAAILALVAMPIVALTTLSGDRQPVGATEQAITEQTIPVMPATNCLMPEATIALATLSRTSLE